MLELTRVEIWYLQFRKQWKSIINFKYELNNLLFEITILQ